MNAMIDPALLQKRLEREIGARQEAERLLETKADALYQANCNLSRASEELAAQSAQLTAILDNALTGMLMADSDRRIVRANAYADRVFGFAPGGLVGLELTSVFKADQVERATAIGLDAVDLELVAGEEMTGLTRSGGIIPLEVRASELFFGDQRHTLWNFVEITGRKLAEARNVREQEERRRAQMLESLGTLSSGIAHEINTPVQFIGDNLHFLQEAFDDLMSLVGVDTETGPASAGADKDAEEAEYLSTEIPQAIAQSIEGVQRISQIVTAVREFSHPGSAEKVEVDLNNAIETTVTIAKSTWKFVAEVAMELEEGLPPVQCVPGEINQVVLNLVTNAAQAIEQAGHEELGTILLATRRIGDEVEIRVSDNGCGIPAEVQSRIFDPFFTTKDVGKGTGQGLSLVHSIVTANHGGRLDFDSHVGVGTSFVISLPIHAGEIALDAA